MYLAGTYTWSKGSRLPVRSRGGVYEAYKEREREVLPRAKNSGNAMARKG
jgi:hypothetical protein